MEKCLEWFDCGEPHADSYARIASKHPYPMEKVDEIVLPIKRAIFGID
jgi:hypothetical protein